jgi:S-adenosylmethionine-dependent methyltransferase
VAQVLRPQGVLSVLAAHRVAAVVARALAGRFKEARQVLGDPDGRWGPGDPLPRRFAADELRRLVLKAGFEQPKVQGARFFTDTIPASFLDGEDSRRDLVELERAAADCPELLHLAASIQVLAIRGRPGEPPEALAKG